MTETEMRRRYDELCSKPNLFAAEVAIVRWLALQLGRRVEFRKVPVWPGK